MGVEQRFAFGQPLFLGGGFLAVGGGGLIKLRAKLRGFLLGGGADFFQLRLGFATTGLLAPTILRMRIIAQTPAPATAHTTAAPIYKTGLMSEPRAVQVSIQRVGVKMQFKGMSSGPTGTASTSCSSNATPHFVPRTPASNRS